MTQLDDTVDEWPLITLLSLPAMLAASEVFAPVMLHHLFLLERKLHVVF